VGCISKKVDDQRRAKAYFKLRWINWASKTERIGNRWRDGNECKPYTELGKVKIRPMQRCTAGRGNYSDLVCDRDVTRGTKNSAVVSKVDKDSTLGIISHLVVDRKGKGEVSGRVGLEHKVVYFATADAGVVGGIENLWGDESGKTGQ
jgi:hypothetical protein